MSAEWFYQIMGEIHGPFNSTQLKQAAERGTIERDTQVRRGEDGEWVLAERIGGLFSESRVPIPAKAGRAGNEGTSTTDTGDVPTVSAAPNDDEPSEPDRVLFRLVHPTNGVVIEVLCIYTDTYHGTLDYMTGGDAMVTSKALCRKVDVDGALSIYFMWMFQIEQFVEREGFLVVY